MSCLFDSLEYFLQIPSNQIRSIICNYLEKGGKIVDGMKTKDLLLLESTNYIYEMRKNSTWGGAIEIKAACNIWNIKIIVNNIRKSESKTNSQIEFIPMKGLNSKTRTINLTWNGFHYEPVRTNNNIDTRFVNKLDKLIKLKKKYEISNDKVTRKIKNIIKQIIKYDTDSKTIKYIKDKIIKKDKKTKIKN